MDDGFSLVEKGKQNKAERTKRCKFMPINVEMLRIFMPINVINS